MQSNYTQIRLMEIEREIKSAESDKRNGIIMMIVSLFFLWPLLIVGIVVYNKANNKINLLYDEKKNIMFMQYQTIDNDKLF